MKDSESISAFLDYLRSSETTYRMEKMNQQDAEDYIQDILHQLELGELDYHGYARAAKRLKEARVARRKAKDYMATVSPILAWIDGNQTVIKGLERLLGEVRKNEKFTENRIYTPKSNVLDEIKNSL